MRQERDAGATYGMLCSKHAQLRHGIHATSAEEWDEFEAKARPWLEKAVSLAQPAAPAAECTCPASDMTFGRCCKAPALRELSIAEAWDLWVSLPEEPAFDMQVELFARAVLAAATNNQPKE